MTKQTHKKSGLDLLREPFPPNQISKLPKPTRQQAEEVRRDFKKGIRCEICGGWHHPKVVHLDYVGHAALTDRLLDADPSWNWEPVALNDDGTPKIDANGGMWIRLTICGITRLGYGHADGKSGGDALKEVIGDALRNAAMRFGAALDLWHKGDLHDVANGDQDADGNAAAKAAPKPQSKPKPETRANEVPQPNEEAINEACSALAAADDLERLKAIWTDLPKSLQSAPAVISAKNDAKTILEMKNTPADQGEAVDDEIPFS